MKKKKRRKRRERDEIGEIEKRIIRDREENERGKGVK